MALLGASSTSASARREAEATFAALRDPGGPARSVLEATTLATLAMEEVLTLGSASTAIDLAQRALAAELPLEPHRGENWALLAIAALGAADELDAAIRGTDTLLSRAREQGAALTVVTVSGLRALLRVRRGDLPGAQADADAAIELAPNLLGSEFVVLAVAAAVLAGLERDETPASLRRLIERSGGRYDTEFAPSTQLLYASGVLRAAAGNHEAAIKELRGLRARAPGVRRREPGHARVAVGGGAFAGRARPPRRGPQPSRRRGGPRPIVRLPGAPWASRFARRRSSGPRTKRSERLAEALAILEASPARLEHARVLVDLGASLRAAGQHTAAREPLLQGLELAARCGARTLERRARAELVAIGVRPRTTERTGTDSLTPSERRVVELAGTGGTNREIAQTLFVTEKTVETHLGRAFRKLDISSRRQLPDVLAGRAG